MEMTLPPIDRLQTLTEISRVVSSTLDLRTLYDTIYEQIGRVMDTSQFFIALHRSDGSALEIPYLREQGQLSLDEEIPYGNNLTSLVIDRGTPVLFHTLREYQEFGERNGLPDITLGDPLTEAMLFVPLSTGSRTIGTLSVQSPRSHAYTQDDLHTLSVIASQAAVSIENARLFQQSQDTVLQMQALLQVAQMINGSLDLQTVLDAILMGMREVVPFFLGAILMPDFRENFLDIVAAVGPGAEERRESFKIPFGQGITGKVFQTGEPLLVPDVRVFPDYVSPHPDVLSEMTVPLKRGEAVVGVLAIERAELDAFSMDELNLLSLFASQAAVAIENARLFTEQQNRVFELQTIQSIVQKITPLHDVPSIASVINEVLKQLIDYHSCRIFILDPQQQLLHPIALGDGELPELQVRTGEGITGWIALHGRSQIIANALEDPRATQIAGTPRRTESIIGAPLVYEGRVQGVITLSKLGADQFDENALRLLEIIAAQAALAFDRARLYAELRTEAITDDLTRLYNRRYLLERFKEEQSRAVRNKHTLVALMLDIDKFKRVNDRFGHDAGDVVLRTLASLVRKVVRAEDVVARYGGEEFCVLLPEIPLQDAEVVAERLRGTVEEYVLPGTAGLPHITVSVGMAVLRDGDEGPELFTRADLAMYEVKRHGGNGVCVVLDDDFRLHDRHGLEERSVRQA